MNSGVSRRLVATAALAAGLSLFAVGCSAGQVTQTDTQVAAVDGASGDVGSIAVRNAMFAFPHEGNRYAEGEEVPLTVVIANSGATPDKLLSVTSSAATGDAKIEGSAELPGFFALHAEHDATAHATSSSGAHPTSSSAAHPSSDSHGAVTTTSAPTSTSSVAPTSGSSSVKPTSSAPSSSKAPDMPVGKIKIVLKGLTQEVVAGQTIKVTFLFEKAGPLTLEVPIAPSPQARTGDGHSGGH